MTEGFERTSAGDSRPVPDPTRLTTEQLFREIGALRELFEARFEQNDKAIVLVQDEANRVPSRVDEKIQSLREIIEEKLNALSASTTEKFNSIQTQFKERDTRAEQTSKDSKVAVDAALQAAKEAVGEQNKSSSLAIAKSEAATMKQIDQMGLLIQTGAKGVDDKFDDLKERLTRIEGQGQGKDQSHNTQQASSNFTAVVVGLVISALLGIAGIVIAVLKR